MNIKDFLMEHYIYIIIIIVLIIITIIGFLADRQKNGGKKSKKDKTESPVPSTNNSAVNNQPITYQPVNNNPPTNDINQMPIVNPMANNNQFSMPNNQPVAAPIPVNGINTPQPVEPMNVTNTPVQEPMYQPLSEQKPVLPSVEPLGTINVNSNNSINTDLNNNVVNSLNNPLNNNVNNEVNNMMTMPEQMMQPINASILPTNPVSDASMPLPTMQPTPMPQPAPVPGPLPIQQPTPVMPTPVNVPPQPVVGEMNFNNAVQAMPQPIPTPNEGVIPTPITPPQPVMPQPVGFVYGPPTQNPTNNQPM